MNIRFEAFKNEVDSLIAFLTSDTWDFHSIPHPEPEKIKQNYESGAYTGSDCKAFWIILDDIAKVGMLRIYDLEDDTPLFDLRILSKYKGQGIGTLTIKWLNDYIFNHFPEIGRIEGATRQDNYGMRRVFHHCGYVKESHFRKSWPDENGNLYDAIGYGITREDWQNGTITPVHWNDFTC